METGFYEENKELIPKRERKNVFGKVEAGVMTYLPSAILTIILIALSGLGTLLQFNFELKSIVWSTFIISLGLRLISIFLSKYVGSNIYYNKALYSDEVQDVKNEFVKAGKSLDKAEFEMYVNKYNLEAKKKAYCVKIRSKIIKNSTIVKKLKHEIELDYSTKKEKQIKKREKIVAELETLCEVDYIDKNIAYIKVKYQKLKTCYFLSPVEDTETKYIQYNVSFSKENAKEIVKTLPLTAMLVFFGTLIGYDVSMGTANIVSVFYDIGNMVFNFIMGWFVVGKKVVSRTINAYINRLTFIAGYNSKNESKNQKSMELVAQNSN